MRWLVIASFIALCGCPSGSPSPPNDDGNDDPDDPSDLPAYPFNFDLETPGGIMLEVGQNNHPPVEDIDLWYEEVQQCVADWYDVLYPTKDFDFVDAPPVILQNNSIDGFCGTNGMIGKYCTNYMIPFVVLVTGSAQFAFNWKHEFIHHILYMNDFSNQLNFNHQPDEIWGCQLN